MPVVARIANNELIWSFNGKHKTLNKFEVKQINLFKELAEFDCTVKVRYRTTAVPCHVVINGDRAKVMLDEAVFGLAKGQIAAFYEGDKLLGGGVIC